MRGNGILIGSDFDMVITPALDNAGMIAGGLVVGGTLYQNQALILAFAPGDVKLAPIVGVGIEGALLDHDFAAWRRLIREQMELDGQQVRSVNFSSTEPLSIDADYNR